MTPEFQDHEMPVSACPSCGHEFDRARNALRRGAAPRTSRCA
jgi:hypothetical protein